MCVGDLPMHAAATAPGLRASDLPMHAAATVPGLRASDLPMHAAPGLCVCTCMLHGIK